MNIWTRKDLKKLDTKELVHPFRSSAKRSHSDNSIIRAHAMLELHSIIKELLSRGDMLEYLAANELLPYMGPKFVPTARALLEELLKNENLLSHE